MPTAVVKFQVINSKFYERLVRAHILWPTETFSPASIIANISGRRDEGINELSAQALSARADAAFLRYEKAKFFITFNADNENSYRIKKQSTFSRSRWIEGGL